MSKRTRGSYHSTYDSFGQEQLNVYDQCCENCRNMHCPMMLGMDEQEIGQLMNYAREEVKRAREQDTIRENGKIRWCIYWEDKEKGRSSKKPDYENRSGYGSYGDFGDTDYINHDFGDGDCDDFTDGEDDDVGDEPSYCEYYDE